MSKAYEVITERILKLIDEGVCPWRMPWSKLPSMPQSNGISKKAYNGCNQFMTSLVACFTGYSSPYWLTYKQAQELGGNVKKGEKGLPIIYFNTIEVEDKASDEGKSKAVPFARYSVVFNAEQCENLPAELLPEPTDIRTSFEKIAACDEIVDGYEGKPDIRIGGNQAYYRASEDYVNMPKQEWFKSDEHYYNTLFHELAHSTGHSKRLARKGIIDPNAFGSREYGQEELVAELTAAFLCQKAGIDASTIEQSAAYLDGWRKTIKEDVKIIAVAAAQAQKAANYIQGIRVAVEVE